MEVFRRNNEYGTITCKRVDRKRKRQSTALPALPDDYEIIALHRASAKHTHHTNYQRRISWIGKRAMAMVPPEPATRRHLVFVGRGDDPTGGDDPKPFLRHDSGQYARDHVIVPDESLRVLCRANTWFMDGNFSLVPPVFDQLYVICALHVRLRLAAGQERDGVPTRRCWRPSLMRARRSASKTTQPPSSPTLRWPPCRT